MTSDGFVGARLRIARTAADLRLTQLAEIVSASAALLSQYETAGLRRPPLDLIDALAQALRVRPDYFYRSLDEEWLETECSFRRYKTASKSAAKRARAIGTILTQITDELRKHFRIPALNVPAVAREAGALDIERVAEACRQHWTLGFGPISQIGRVAEANGMLLARNASDHKIDAFSRRGRYVSMIVLNGIRESTSRQIFDVAHEIGHFALHQGIPTGTDETEQEANAFAAAFLMPKKTFAMELASSRKDTAALFELKRRWSVSVQAIARRARDLGVMDPISYRRFYRLMSAKGWVRSEPYEPEFVGPEWLRSAFSPTNGFSAFELCARLAITPELFQEVTGIEALPPKARLAVANSDFSFAFSADALALKASGRPD